MSLKNILIIDKNDNIIDTADKVSIHRKGLLHRAFSILIFNRQQQLVLQRRAMSKYHSAGLWTNTCCGHPFNEKSIIKYAQQRLKEEMGMNCDLIFTFKFAYHSTLENGLIENEIDHVFIGITEQEPILNLEETDSYMWVNEIDLRNDIQIHPEKYTIWFRIILEHLQQKNTSFKQLLQENLYNNVKAKKRYVKLKKNTLQVRKNSVSETKNALSEGKNGLRERKNATSETKNTLQDRKNELSEGKNAPSERKNILSKAKNGVQATKNALQEQENMAPQAHHTPHERYSIKPTAINITPPRQVKQS